MTVRIALYSPDSYGLGHVRRSISLTRAVLGRFPQASALLLTGAPRAHYFDYPPRCDYLKLPSITKDECGDYTCRDLDLPLRRAVLLRGRLIRTAVEAFDADALLVDHSPLGLCGEILGTLRHLASRGAPTLRVLGLRDVIDDPARVRRVWDREGVVDLLRRCYDHILVYGQRDLFDVVRSYGIPPDVEHKLTYVGYVPRNGRKADPQELRARHAPRTGRLVVVTLGGGGDGNLVLRSFLEGFRRLGPRPPFEVLAVTGPLMSPRKRKRFRDRSRELPGVELLDYTDAMPDLIEAADFVVAMGGYNTTCELACAGARALIVPRCFPRQEQLVRARMLARRGMVSVLADREPDPDALVAEVLRGLERERPPRGWGLDFGGLERTVDVVARLLAAPQSTSSGASPHGIAAAGGAPAANEPGILSLPPGNGG